MNNESALDLIKLKLNETTLGDYAKEELGKKSEEIYQKLASAKIGGIKYSKEEIVDVANTLACDVTYCAIPRQLPRTHAKLRKKAREITGIQPITDTEARMDKTIRLLENSLEYFQRKEDYRYSKKGLKYHLSTLSPEESEFLKKKVKKEVKTMVKNYVQKYSENKATVPHNSVITTGAAYYIAALLQTDSKRNNRITQEMISESLGISIPSLKSSFIDIADTLDIEVIL